MEKLFKLKENGTSVKTEIIAGLTTFMTMAYIIALNPNLLTNFDVGSSLWNGIFLATCIASAIGMFVMAFVANKPFAMAPGMGLNSFFAFVVTQVVSMTTLSYLESFQACLCIILIEGVIFVVLSIFNIRDKIVNAILFFYFSKPDMHSLMFTNKGWLFILVVLSKNTKGRKRYEKNTYSDRYAE